MIRITQFLGVVLVLVGSCLADTEAPAFPKVTATLDGRHFFSMVPPIYRESDYEMLKKPYGILYQPQPDGTFKELWRVKGWYSHEVYLSYDAKYLVRMGPWQTGTGPTKHHLAVEFYAEGKLLKKYSVARLIKDDSKVLRSVSHYNWRSDGDGFPYLSPNGYLFRIRTVENRIFNFSVSDGKLIGVEKYKSEPAGADQPATKPADKPPVKDQPSTPTPKDAPR